MPRSNSPAVNYVVLILSCFLAGCMDFGYRQGVVYDGAPRDNIDVSTIADAVPRLDPVTRAGNKNPYTVLGKTYHLLPTSKGYREVGLASWYGTKFHGKQTSNGETYSMYGMTAAHKTLPIPAYARVRNLANNRSVIVRINDRGPFHSDRIIDLSYAAAKKLGYAGLGTARVEVTVIDPVAFQGNSVQVPSIASASVPLTVSVPGQPLISPVLSPGMKVPSIEPEALRVEQKASYGNQTGPESTINRFLQVGAYRSYQSAVLHRQQVAGLTQYPVVIEEALDPIEKISLFKVLVGPVAEAIQLQELRRELALKGRSRVFTVYKPTGAGL